MIFPTSNIVMLSFPNNGSNLLSALNKYRIFGYTKHNFKIMIDKGVKRFQKKMNNIEKHFKNNKI